MPLPKVMQASQLPAVAIPLLPRTAATLRSAGGVAPGKTLGFVMQHQLQTNWCWAGVAASTSAFYLPTTTWTQCQVVTLQLGDPTCCNNPCPTHCNRDGFLDQALSATGNLVTWGSQLLLFSQIQLEIGINRPVAFRIGWNGGGGHFLAVTGFKDNGLQQTVDVKDPWYGDSTVVYNDLLTSYQGNGTCTHHYYTKP